MQCPVGNMFYLICVSVALLLLLCYPLDLPFVSIFNHNVLRVFLPSWSYSPVIAMFPEFCPWTPSLPQCSWAAHWINQLEGCHSLTFDLSTRQQMNFLFRGSIAIQQIKMLCLYPCWFDPSTHFLFKMNPSTLFLCLFLLSSITLSELPYC